jgi:hypothetical protein
MSAKLFGLFYGITNLFGFLCTCELERHVNRESHEAERSKQVVKGEEIGVHSEQEKGK